MTEATVSHLENSSAFRQPSGNQEAPIAAARPRRKQGHRVVELGRQDQPVRLLGGAVDDISLAKLALVLVRPDVRVRLVEFIAARLADLVIARPGSDHPFYTDGNRSKNRLRERLFHRSVASDPEGRCKIIVDNSERPSCRAAAMNSTNRTRTSGRTSTSASFAREMSSTAPPRRRHRLILPAEFDYTMTLFRRGRAAAIGASVFPDGWRNADDVLKMENGASVMTEGSPCED